MRDYLRDSLHIFNNDFALLKTHVGQALVACYSLVGKKPDYYLSAKLAGVLGNFKIPRGGHIGAHGNIDLFHILKISVFEEFFAYVPVFQIHMRFFGEQMVVSVSASKIKIYVGRSGQFFALKENF